MKKKTKISHSFGFTLAEVLITLVILGIVAAITVPSIARKQVERTNRVKVKKAMAAYEQFINTVAIEHNVKSLSELNMVFSNKNDPSEDICAKAASYFNVKKYTTVKSGSNIAGCTIYPKGGGKEYYFFGAYFGLNGNNGNYSRLDISEMQVNLNNGDKRTYSYSMEAFVEPDRPSKFRFFTRFDSNGNIRINDLAYEEANCGNSLPKSCAYTQNLYRFINNINFDEWVNADLTSWKNYASNTCADGETVSCKAYGTGVLTKNRYTVYDDLGRVVAKSNRQGTEIESITNYSADGSKAIIYSLTDGKLNTQYGGTSNIEIYNKTSSDYYISGQSCDDQGKSCAYYYVYKKTGNSTSSLGRLTGCDADGNCSSCTGAYCTAYNN